MSDFKFTGPRFNPSSYSVGGLVAPLVFPQSAPISSISTPSSFVEVDWENVMLTIAVVGVSGYVLYRYLESRDRNRLYAY
jgi:hypothetical protein